MSEVETKVGVWRRCKLAPGFWWRSIVTIGIYPLIVWRKNQIMLTTRRVTQRTGGIIGGKEVAISLENITDVSVEKTFTGTMLGYSAVRIQSAGSSTVEIAFNELANADDLKNAIFDLKDGKFDGGGDF